MKRKEYAPGERGPKLALLFLALILFANSFDIETSPGPVIFHAVTVTGELSGRTGAYVMTIARHGITLTVKGLVKTNVQYHGC